MHDVHQWCTDSSVPRLAGSFLDSLCQIFHPLPAPGVLRAYGQAPRMAEQQESDPGLLEKFESVPVYANCLLTCGKRLYHQEQYEGALQAFMHSVSVMEQPGQTFDADELEWRGAMLHNMASCLHHLAELDAARAYYELAIASFRHAEVHGCLLYTSPSPRDGLLSRMPSSA